MKEVVRVKVGNCVTCDVNPTQVTVYINLIYILPLFIDNSSSADF